MQIYNNFKECGFRIKNILLNRPFFNKGAFQSLMPVSYTHLTLPTKA